MIGSIGGDIIGSVFEWNRTKSTDFELFCTRSTYTDDTVLTVAVADCILNCKDYANTLQEYGKRYPDRGYGAMFNKWIGSSDPKPYNSYGNGSAMRVSPVGFAFDSIEEVLEEAKKTAEVSHNHPEGIKGAQATAAAVFLAKIGESKAAIKKYIKSNFNYNLDRSLDDIRPEYGFDETCQYTVPEAIIAFLESKDYEDAVRKAISLGGDSDTLACITGGIAEAFYKKIPDNILKEIRKRLDKRLLLVVEDFNKKF